MENLKVATRANHALKSTRPAKRQKTSSYPDKMWLVLELVYMKVLQQWLVRNDMTGHNFHTRVIDQIYDTAYTVPPDVAKTGCVCKHTRGMLQKYIESQQKRILCSMFTWSSVIQYGVGLCDFLTYDRYFSSFRYEKRNFFPMDRWMPSFNYVRNTLSSNGKPFGTLHVTRITKRRKEKRKTITSHILVAKLTVYTSDGQPVDFEPFEVEVDKMCWEEWEQDVEPQELLDWRNRLFVKINKYAFGQARDFFKCS